MTRILKLSGILGLIAMIMSFALAEIYIITSPEIARQLAEKTQKALQTVMPETKTGAIEEVKFADGKVNYYIGYSDTSKNDLVGYAFEAKKPGYSGDVISIVGIDTSGIIKGIVVTRQTETPGLGAKCTINEPFDGKKYSLQQFTGKAAEDLKVDKDGGEIISITGATITTRTIAKSVKEKMEQVIKETKTGA